MLKRYFLIGILLVGNLFAQDFNNLRIYINPGHGGHDSNDRYIPETGFWESEGNLAKGLYLRDLLVSFNANVRMSRVTNNSSDDLPLSQISEDANNFDADFFHSIHSNAFNGQTNYTLLLYKEVNGAPAFPEAKQMCDIMADKIYKAHRTTTKYTRGDYSFLGFNLGVLRNLNMPGTLSEGSFHDYIPESWRLRNEAYLKHEAWAIAKAFIDYFGLQTLQVGEIAGILRDHDKLVDYYYKPSTNDGKKPLNNIHVTLLPDNKIYNGDSYNNGFYLFDSLTPGNYQVIVTAEDYSTDTLDVVVQANQTSFADKWLTLVENLNAPQVISFTPQNGSTDVRLSSVIEINFDIPMDKSSVQNAFSVSPTVSGTFNWSNNDKTVKFTPSAKLTKDTQYTVSVDTSAKTVFGVSLSNKLSFTFKTRKKLNLVSFYPSDNSTDISTTVVIILTFDAPISVNTLGSNIFFKDADDNSVSLAADQSAFEKGQIIFWSVYPLEYNSQYKIILNSGIGDIDGLTLEENYEINFTTEKNTYSGGSIIDSFETAGDWWEPEQSGSTVGVDPAVTNFEITSEKKYSGSLSGKLTYKFTSENGVCRLYNPLEPNLGSNDNGIFGMWVFGDLSGNILEYWFRDSQGTNVPYFVDTLNWTGWKLKTISLGDLGISGDKKFHSIVVKRTVNGNSESELYFDDLQTDIILPVRTENSLPVTYRLYQNYPNPFNPSTTIKYSIPKTPLNPPFAKGGKTGGFVTLKIYDVLGREISTLVNKEQAPGTYSVTFNAQYAASELPSGIYFYTLRAGGFVQTRKMILLK